MAHSAGMTAVVSHRSGETDDTTIWQTAVALNTGQIKSGAPARSDRVENTTRLMEIEELLGAKAEYAGWDAFKVSRAKRRILKQERQEKSISM